MSSPTAPRDDVPNKEEGGEEGGDGERRGGEGGGEWVVVPSEEDTEQMRRALKQHAKALRKLSVEHQEELRALEDENEDAHYLAEELCVRLERLRSELETMKEEQARQEEVHNGEMVAVAAGFRSMLQDEASKHAALYEEWERERRQMAKADAVFTVELEALRAKYEVLQREREEVEEETRIAKAKDKKKLRKERQLIERESRALIDAAVSKQEKKQEEVSVLKGKLETFRRVMAANLLAKEQEVAQTLDQARDEVNEEKKKRDACELAVLVLRHEREEENKKYAKAVAGLEVERDAMQKQVVCVEAKNNSLQEELLAQTALALARTRELEDAGERCREERIELFQANQALEEAKQELEAKIAVFAEQAVLIQATSNELRASIEKKQADGAVTVLALQEEGRLAADRIRVLEAKVEASCLFLLSSLMLFLPLILFFISYFCPTFCRLVGRVTLINTLSLFFCLLSLTVSFFVFFPRI